MAPQICARWRDGRRDSKRISARRADRVDASNLGLGEVVAMNLTVWITTVLNASDLSANCLTRDLSAFQRGSRTCPWATAIGRSRDARFAGASSDAAPARDWWRPSPP